jgi:hypothetical protein
MILIEGGERGREEGRGREEREEGGRGRGERERERVDEDRAQEDTIEYNGIGQETREIGKQQKNRRKD